MSMGIQKAIELAERQEDEKVLTKKERKRLAARRRQLDREREKLVRSYRAGDDLR